MNDLIAQLAPMLRCLTHPGNERTPPYPLALPTFAAATLPPGMAEELRQELGVENPDISTAFLEALLHTIDQLGRTVIAKTELDELRTAASANEHKRNQVKQFVTDCGAPLFRATIRDFDTDKPRITCGVIKAVGQMSGNCANGHR
jgi:hypothetical protein